MIYVVATLKVKPGRVEQLIEAAEACIRGTRAEPGNISYDLNRQIDQPETLVFVERWQSRDDLTAHFSAPHMLVYRAATQDLIADRKVEIIEPAKVEVL